MWQATVGVSAIASTSRGVTSPGSIDEMRSRARPSSRPTSRTRSARSPLPDGIPPGADVDAGEHQLRVPVLEPPPRVAQDRLARSALGTAARAGDDAERASLVAAVLHLHERARAARGSRVVVARHRRRRAEARDDLDRHPVGGPVDDRDPGAGELVAVQVRGAPGDECARRHARRAVDLLAALALGLQRERAGVDDVHLGGVGLGLGVTGVAERVADEHRIGLADLAPQEAHRERAHDAAPSKPRASAATAVAASAAVSARRVASPRRQTATPRAAACATSASENPASGPTTMPTRDWGRCAHRLAQPGASRGRRRGMSAADRRRPPSRKTVPSRSRASPTRVRIAAPRPRRAGPGAPPCGRRPPGRRDAVRVPT